MNALLEALTDWLSQNQTLAGSIVIGLSALGIALASFIKTIGDKAKKSERKKRMWAYALWAISVLACGLGTCYGTFLTRRAAEKASEHAATIQKDTDDKIERQQREFREKFQTVLVKLNAAKQEESKAITEEKIRTIKSDLVQWAQDFLTNLPAARTTFAQQKMELQKKQTEEANKLVESQKQRSGQCYPAFSFAVRLLQESVRAYAKAAGKTNIVVEPLDLPENLYGERKASTIIRFGTNGTCTVRLAAGFIPGVGFASDYAHDKPHLRITFTGRTDERTGDFYLHLNDAATKLRLAYTTSLPVPTSASISGEYDLSDYETPIRNALQQIIKAQLLQLEGS